MTCCADDGSSAPSCAAVDRPGPSPEPDYLGDALARLPARERIALVLRHYEGLSEREIAEAMHCPAGTVKTLLHRGTQRLRGQIEP